MALMNQHDVVLPWRGIETLLGERVDHSPVFLLLLFKRFLSLSSREWCDIRTRSGYCLSEFIARRRKYATGTKWLKQRLSSSSATTRLMDEVLDIMFHHGGSFEKGVDGKIGYYPDNRNCLGDVEVDRLDVFYLRNYYKELGYDRMKEVWWLVPGKSIGEGLRKLNSDADLREMCDMGSQNAGLVDIYIEHQVSSPELIEGEEVMVYIDDQVRDLGTQAKENVAAAPDDGSRPNHEKNPTANVSRRREEGVKASVKVPSEQKIKKKVKNTLKPSQTKVHRRYCLRSATGIGGTKAQKRGQGSKIPVMLMSSDEESSKTDDSSEDEPYKPVREDSSSDSCAADPVPSPKVKGKKKTSKGSASQDNGKGKNKMKEKICVDEDAYVEGNSDVEVDFGKVGTDKNDDYDAYDPGTDSDGANSWHSLEMKTPPNSEDELEEETESDEVFPVFREGARFGELHLEVGMKFKTKWDFKEAVREYTIQEGRRIRFNKNDRNRLRAVCKVKECGWVIFASKDRDDTCWKVKTFRDDHSCAREDKNRAANRNWVASKLVKKVRKYPNFRHCDANTFFKTKYDLSLNRNSISRALSDARNLVYGDEKAQYAMVRDYGETLLKTNPGSTVKICTIPQPNGDVIFEKMYVCLSGCKNGFKAGCRPLIGLDGAYELCLM
ncbi:hypothetical protein Ahy_A06g025857 [Arachis hypogaea]|uniref:Uncharacterized protein n=1 Tax=Arachis hypogaea TaxID=3818 RepID=A0A445CIV6_ARAHY|nr:hypothetical protein Ahy_A06g025857 [Arachis hypogaea]